ncbi:MAG TPA: hypothetical protein DCY88_31230 [Cyanobacteria bacterium UBA11372]|nr:hypothetical protein [Cyanobacteria bacterium UBA11372]
MNKIAKLAAIATTLSCAVLLPVNQAKATTFSFTQGGYSFSSWFSPKYNIPQPITGGLNFDLTSSNNTISGSFTGEDLNADSIISGSEVTNFSLNFFGVSSTFASSFAFNLLTRDLSFNSDVQLVREFPPLPCPVPRPFTCGVPLFGTNSGSLELNTTGGNFGWSIFTFDYLGTLTGRSFQRPQITEITQAKPVPEPDQNAIVLVSVMVAGFLLSHKISSSKTQKM